MLVPSVIRSLTCDQSGAALIHSMSASDPKRTSKDVRLSRSGHVQPVERAERLAYGMLYMRVDHGRLEISVTEQ